MNSPFKSVEVGLEDPSVHTYAVNLSLHGGYVMGRPQSLVTGPPPYTTFTYTTVRPGGPEYFDCISHLVGNLILPAQ